MLHRPLYRRKAGYSFIRSLNPAAWFMKGVGQTVTGSGVSTWADQSGNGRDLLQGTDAARPALQADGSVLFNGTSHYLKCNAFTLNQPETVLLAFKQVSWTIGDNICDGNGSSTMAVYNTTASPEISIYAGASAAANSGLSVGAYGALAAVFNGASSSLRINNSAATTGSSGASNAGGFTLGSNAAPGSYSNIQVLEAIILPAALSTSQITRAVYYLAARHGVSL